MSLAEIVKAYDVRGVVPDQLDAEVARALGAAFADVVAAPRIVIAHDMRESGPELAQAFAAGAAARGTQVTAAGLASTDMLYFAAGSLDLPGAMFTASHNPARYNGIKMCRAGAVAVRRWTPGWPRSARLTPRPCLDGGLPLRCAERRGTVSELQHGRRVRRLPALAWSI